MTCNLTPNKLYHISGLTYSIEIRCKVSSRKTIEKKQPSLSKFGAVWLVARHSQGFISTGMIHVADGFPTLTVKAWNGQVLLYFLDVCMGALLEEHQNPVVEEIQLARLATRSLVVWFDRLSRYPRYLSEWQAKDLSSHGFYFLRVFQKLSYISVIQHINRWKILPKFHPFRHINEDVAKFRMNYRYCHTFKDEDNVGVCKALAQKVAKGPLLEYRVLTRFLLRLASWQPSGR